MTTTDGPPRARQGDVEALAGGLSEENALGALEAILMVADAPVPATDLATALGLPTARVETMLRDLAAEYAGLHGGRHHGFELREVGAGWRFYSAPAFAEVVGAFVLEGQTARLTQAALETLAIIAYRQPITRGRVSAVRGVNVDGVVRTLLSRGLIDEAGQDPDGGATLYRTSTTFLERFGLRSLEDLPPLAPYLPEVGDLGDVEGGVR
jgi:segregation and condensation protein B